MYFQVLFSLIESCEKCQTSVARWWKWSEPHRISGWSLFRLTLKSCNISYIWQYFITASIYRNMQITFELMPKTHRAFTEIHKTWGVDTDGVAFVQLSEICLDFMLSWADCLMTLTTCFCPLYLSLLLCSALLITFSCFLILPSCPPSSREQ